MDASFATIWDAIARAIPDHLAVVRGDRRVSWREHEERAARLAAGFAASGLQPGGRVVLFLPNVVELLECVYACSKLGAVAAGINHRLLAADLAELATRARAEVVVYSASATQTVAEARDELPELRALVTVGDAPEPPVRGATAYDDLVRADEPLPRRTRPGDDLLLWHTGGTTGRPKGVCWRQDTLATAAIESAATVVGIDPPATPEAAARTAQTLGKDGNAPICLVTTPLVHASAAHQAQSAHLLGGTVVLLAGRRTDGDEICAAVERERVTVLGVIGDTVAGRIVGSLDAGRQRGVSYDLSSIRRVHNSGAVLSPPLKDALLGYGVQSVYDSVGSSEGTGYAFALATKPGQSADARFTLGPRARVVDERGLDVSAGDAGLLAVSQTIAEGYDGDPDGTAATFRTIDGVRHAVPGDWAIPDGTGGVVLLGRGTSCISTGGEKVWPDEVEHLLTSHPDIDDAVVVGYPHEDWGEAVAAVVAVHAGTKLSAGQLTSWLHGRLAGFKRPRRIVFVDHLERTALGKHDREWARSVAR